MRDLSVLDEHRSADALPIYGWLGDSTCGAFKFPSPVDGQPLSVIASSEMGWDHVSVARQKRVPNWYEMEFIKRRFFKDDETAMQLHVPTKDHISLHPNCLHLWRPQQLTIPLPPPEMVAVLPKRGRTK